MKHLMRSVPWRFCDSSLTYPELSQNDKVYVKSPDDVVQRLRFHFKDQVKERFVVLWPNSASRVTDSEIVSEGTLNASVVHPREILRGAIVTTSAAIIIAHNHPSGNPAPNCPGLHYNGSLMRVNAAGAASSSG